MAHLERLASPGSGCIDPLKIATEGALWGSVVAHGLRRHRQRRRRPVIGSHALCWVHAERLTTSWSASTTASGRRVRGSRPEGILPRCHSAQKAGEARLTGCSTTTGFATLDRLLARLHANKLAPRPRTAGYRSEKSAAR